MRKALIDFSSTALSLLVMDDGLRPVFRLRRSLSIVEYMTKKGRLQDRGIEKVLEAVAHLKEAAEEVGARRIYLIATASMRLIANHGEVSDRIRAMTGLSLTILSGREEAYCAASVNRGYAEEESALLLDIGGATCQIADLREPDMENMFSLPIGPVALRRFSSSLYPDEDEIREMRKEIKKVLSRELVYPGAGFGHLVLIGSNCEALYSVYADYFSLPESSLRAMDRKKLKKLIKHLLSSEERSMLFIRNAPEKVHTLIPAALLAYETASHFSADELVISDKGVKEGYLRILVEG